MPELSGSVRELAAAAVDALEERQSTWRPAEVVREAAAALPTTTAVSAREVVAHAERARAVAERELLVELSRAGARGGGVASGRAPGDRIGDRAGVDHPGGARPGSRPVGPGRASPGRHGEDTRALPEDFPAALTGPQVEAAAAVAGTGELVLVVGPAGTGKTTALAPAVAQLHREGRDVFGVAPSAAAAEVLAAGTGVDADTLDKLLVEHRGTRPPEPRYRLGPGTTLVVDEAAMVPTGRLAELFALADERSWRLALVGDPWQFAPVGRGGMFGHLVDRYGAIELDRVHRFTEPWERDASLRLRRGDPDVIALYDAHGRLHGGTPGRMADAAIDAWWTAREDGRTTALMAPTRRRRRRTQPARPTKTPRRRPTRPRRPRPRMRRLRAA